MAGRKSRTNDLQGSLFDIPGMAEDFPVHPSISDFVVSQREAQKNQQEQVDSLDLGMNINDEEEPPLLFISFGSGSSGNCAYIGTRNRGVLIDAGVDPAVVMQGMKNNGLSLCNVEGICLTHDHSDHVRYVYNIVRKNPGMSIYCTPKTLNGLLRRHSISRRIKDYHSPIYKEFPFTLAGMEITAFDVCHDGTDNCGYFITYASHKFAMATDLGSISDRVDHYMRQAQHIVIESNYDKEMLAKGPYPQYLKARIAAGYGHLDNCITAEFLTHIYTPQLRNIFLCHLSQDNNTPEIALATIGTALLDSGIPAIGNADNSIKSRQAPLQLYALPRYGESLLFMFRPED